MKDKVRIGLRYILIISGVLVLLFPSVSSYYQEYQQEQLIRQWQESLVLIDEGATEEVAVEVVVEEPTEELSETKKLELEEKKKKEKEAQEARQAYINANMHGILTISKIKLNLPILKGATEKNLKLSVASLDNMGVLGEVGNFAIAGHRMRAYGKIFNRLDELDVGDAMEIKDDNQTYYYQVSEKLFVLPEETWVLKSNHVGQEVTLIACHPIYNPTHRIIIKAKRVN